MNGFIIDSLDRVRKYTDEPEVNAKWTDNQLIVEMGRQYSRVLQEVNRMSDSPIVCRYSLTVDGDSVLYALPPSVGEIMRISELDSNTGLTVREFLPRSRWNIAGPVYTIEGNIIRFQPALTSEYDLVIEYIPRGDVSLFVFQGVIGATDSGDDATDGNWVRVPDPAEVTTTNVPYGEIDQRPNAYVGMMVRILDDNNRVIQERTISKYTVPEGATPTDGKIYVSLDFDPTLASDVRGLKYEVVPHMSPKMEQVVELATARYLLGVEGTPERRRDLDKRFLEEMRDLRLFYAGMEGRFGKNFTTDTVDNPNYLPYTIRGW